MQCSWAQLSRGLRGKWLVSKSHLIAIEAVLFLLPCSRINSPFVCIALKRAKRHGNWVAAALLSNSFARSLQFFTVLIFLPSRYYICIYFDIFFLFMWKVFHLQPIRPYFLQTPSMYGGKYYVIISVFHVSITTVILFWVTYFLIKFGLLIPG